jgi:hypothetical protein
MDPQKPNYFRPALIAGAVAGLLSGLPFIGMANCVCCLWIVGGAAVAVRLLAAATPAVLTSGDGAVVGALTGITAALTDAVVSIPLRSFNLELGRRLLDKAADMGGEVPAGLDGIFNTTGGISPGWFLLGLFLSAAIFALMGALGGIIGVSLFARKAAAARTGSTPPPPTPPQPPQGPSDAA